MKIKSKYFLFLDSHDYYFPETLKKVFEKSETTNADITFFGFIRFEDGTGNTLSVEMVHNKKVLVTNVANEPLFMYMNPAPWNKLVKTEIIDESIRFGNQVHAEDLFFFLKLLTKAKVIALLNEPLYMYHDQKDSLTNPLNNERFEKSLSDFGVFGKNYCFNRRGSYYNLLVGAMFIRLGLGLTIRASQSEPKSTFSNYRLTRECLYKNYPFWYDSKF